MNRRSLITPVAAIAAGIVLAALPGCSAQVDPWPEKPGPRVLTSFAPLYCFALNVAGEDATVRCVMSDTGPHHFDPGPHHALAVRRADLFLINGLELDDTIARKMARSSRNPQMKLIEIASAIPKSRLREGGCNCGHEHAGHQHHHDDAHEHYDPHVWLGIPEAITMVERIRDVLKETDPANAKGYDDRAASYVKRLNRVLEEGRQELAGKKDRKILTFHDSLFYFARAFDLEIVDSIETAPGNEPDPKKLAELIANCKAKGVRVIAVEPQYDSNTSAKRILTSLRNSQINAEFATVDPLETARPDELNAEFYERKMRENIRNLADKLK